MAESINSWSNSHSSLSDGRALRALLLAQEADNAVYRAALTAMAAKLDLDAGVTDTNYAATLATLLGKPNLTK